MTVEDKAKDPPSWTGRIREKLLGVCGWGIVGLIIPIKQKDLGISMSAAAGDSLYLQISL